MMMMKEELNTLFFSAPYIHTSAESEECFAFLAHFDLPRRLRSPCRVQNNGITHRDVAKGWFALFFL